MGKTKSIQFWTTLALVATLLAMIKSSRLFAQAITGDILGTVRDASGAVVPGAKVVLTQTTTGVKFMATTDTGGNYLFAQLKPNRYSLTVSKHGFQSTTVSDIDLLVGQRPRVDVVLQVGSVTETVNVNAGGIQLLDTQTSSMGQVLEDRTIVNLPLNTRNFMQLVTLAAGVSPIGSGNSPASFWTGAGSGQVTASIAGLRESDESFLVNGIETRNSRFGSVGLRPSIDAIQEFKMQTDNFSAETGRSAAVINTTLKSGSNQLHGSLFEFIRNDSLDANDFFFNLVGTRIPHYVQNDFGGSLGGPLVIPRVYNGHQKTFWFINYEGFRSRQGLTGTALLPSRAQLGGDLADNSAGTGIFPVNSAYCQANPGSPKCVNVIDPTTGQPFPGNVIPTNRLNPVSQKWLSFIPVPNVVVPQGLLQNPIFNYTASPVVRNDFNQFNITLNHSISSKDQIFGSYSYDDRPHIVPSVMPLQGVQYPFREQLVTLTGTHTFSPTVVNELRLGYNRNKTFLVSQAALGPNYAADLFGFTNTSTNPFDFGVPTASIPGFNSVGSFPESIGNIDNNFQVVDNLSVVRGNHNLKAGMDYMYEPIFNFADFAGIPSLVFDGRFTHASLGDFLLGTPFQASTSVGDASQHLRTHYYAGYVQDDWRVTSSLTANLGIRYEYQQPPYDARNRTEWFDPAVAQVVTSSSGGVRNGVVDPDYNNFAPRVGFAYSPAFLKNTAFRGSFGIFYATDNYNELDFLVLGPPYYSSQTLNSNPVTPTLSLSSLFPPPTIGGTVTPFSTDKRNRTPYVQEWNFDVQHTFGTNWLVDLGYIGDTGQKLPQRRNQNIARPDPTGTIPIQQRVPYPNLSWILLAYNGGWSSYNALTARVEKRFSQGFSFLASYTWEHALDLGGTDDFSMASCCFKVLDKGNSDYMVPQRLTLSYVYELPVGRGKHFLSGTAGFPDKLIKGWQVSGITTFSMGQFGTPVLGFDWTNLGAFSTSLPDRIGNPVPANRTYQNWVTPSAFITPGCPSFTRCANGIHVEGNAARNSVEFPGINNWDLAIMKNTRIGERLSAQFRAEMFNAWNHAQFGPPNLSLASGQFGRIGSLLIAPREIQFALKLIF